MGIEIGSASELEDACEDLESAGEQVFEIVFEASTGGVIGVQTEIWMPPKDW